MTLHLDLQGLEEIPEIGLIIAQPGTLQYTTAGDKNTQFAQLFTGALLRKLTLTVDGS